MTAFHPGSILIGHVLDRIKDIPDNSIHLCCTSPPYYGLRDYGLPPVVWGGDPSHTHTWETVFTVNQNAGGGITHKQETNRGSYSTEQARDGGPLPRKIEGKRGHSSGFCSCGAWLGCLGLEPASDCLAWARGETPCSSCYICHLRSIFAEVFRVLRPDGSLWLNLGDSYAGSGGSRGDYKAGGTREGQPRVKGSSSSLPTKNLMMIPSRAALALQADGFVLRSELPWIKGSAMPSSVTDRPCAAHEHFYLLTKRQSYYYDQDSVRMPCCDDRMGNPGCGGTYGERVGNHLISSGVYTGGEDTGGRSRRTSDAWNESLHSEIEAARKWLRHLETIRVKKGLLCDEDGDPLAVNINPKGSSVEHFATYNGDLIRPMIKSGTSEVGCCSECGAPWKRVTAMLKSWRNDACTREQAYVTNCGNRQIRPSSNGGMSRSTYETKGWQPSCSHNAETMPCTVLDPFLGSGTTALVAMELGRDWVGIEASEKYAAIAQRRIDAARLQTRLFTTAETVAASPTQLSLSLEEVA